MDESVADDIKTKENELEDIVATDINEDIFVPCEETKVVESDKKTPERPLIIDPEKNSADDNEYDMIFEEDKEEEEESESVKTQDEPHEEELKNDVNSETIAVAEQSDVNNDEDDNEKKVEEEQPELSEAEKYDNYLEEKLVMENDSETEEKGDDVGLEEEMKQQDISQEMEPIAMGVVQIKEEQIDDKDENSIDVKDEKTVHVGTTISSGKRKAEDMDWSSDEEGFAGFEEVNGTFKDFPAFGKHKKIKEEIDSDCENSAMKSYLIDEQDNLDSQQQSQQQQSQESDSKNDSSITELDQSTASSSKNKLNRGVPLTDPIYQKPFEYGWKRELVYRAIPDISKEKGEVYYITPQGKKLRTRAEIQANLHEGLTMFNFTLSKDSVGAPPEFEIIRSAKWCRRSTVDIQQKTPPLCVVEPLSVVLGKRIPKPKAPKGASPPPASRLISKSKTSRHSLPATLKKPDDKLLTSTPINNKSGTKQGQKLGGTKKGGIEQCTIQCMLAMGKIPQLQCKKCRNIYHHECIIAVSTSRTTDVTASPSESINSDIGIIKGLTASGYICENCFDEKPTVDTTNGKTLVNSSRNPTTTTTTSSSTATIGINNKSPPMSPQINLNTNASITATTKRSQDSLVGSMTTWLPANTNLTNYDNKNNKASAITGTLTSPQSIAVIGGRKYIVVPKTNELSVSPSAGGDTRLMSSMVGNKRDKNRYNTMSGNDNMNNNNINNNNNNNSNNNVDQITIDNGGNELNSSSSTAVSGTTINDGLAVVSVASPVSGKRRTGSSNVTPVTSRLNSPQLSNNTNENGSNNNNNINDSMIISSSSKAIGTNKNNKLITDNCSLSNSKITFNKGTQTILSYPALNFFSNVSIGYDVLLHIFQYLKVQELLRAGCVCRLWNQGANHSSLWKTVRMKNSQVNDWTGFVNTLKLNGTRHLDLRKMLIPSNSDKIWKSFSENIGHLDNLQCIDLCRCSAQVVENLFLTNSKLKILNAVTINNEVIDIQNLSKMEKLNELRLKTTYTYCTIKGDLEPLRNLVELRHLSLTSVRNLCEKNIEIIGNLVNLESLELGECSELTEVFANAVLPKLKKLERLRLEKGQECCTFEILEQISTMDNLIQLELVNFDIKAGFDDHLAKCTNIKKLLIIPTYVSQSATTNRLVLSGLLKLTDSLTILTWAITVELIRVTELYVDQCASRKKDKKQSVNVESIPVLTPVPGTSAACDDEKIVQNDTLSSAIPKVEILPLTKVEKILNSSMPNSKIRIIKIPMHATWRQNLGEQQ